MARTEVKTRKRASAKLGDFTMTPRSISISLLAVIIGAVSAFVALGLLKLIGLFTNLFFFPRWGTALVSPAGNPPGAWSIRVPGAWAEFCGGLERYLSSRTGESGLP